MEDNKPAAGRPTAAQSATPRRDNPLTLKILFIGLIMLLLLIPGSMIRNLIEERETMMERAQDEVSRMWGGEQHLTGPVLTIPYARRVVDEKGRAGFEQGALTLLPEDLAVNGQIASEQRRRGFYDTNVYTAQLQLDGAFVVPHELRLLESDPKYALDWASAAVSVGISDLRGIEECVEIELDGRRLPTVTESNNPNFEIGVSTRYDAGAWAAAEGRRLPYRIELRIKGSKGLFIAPAGNRNDIRLAANCPTPGFCGNFLPSTRRVDDDSFAAQWKVVAQNREYPQLLRDNGNNASQRRQAIAASRLGVNLLVPVTQYRQATRAVKYAVLVIVLTFIGVFFVEMTKRRNIHAFQYLLVGLALILFYALLVSISEHANFGIAYLLAAAMTVTLIACYIYGILRLKTTALHVGLLLALLYAYIYVLLQLEVYALLAGSIGLFCILALTMRYSLKMEWTAPSKTER